MTHYDSLQAVTTGTRKDTKENLKITKPLTRSSTIDTTKINQNVQIKQEIAEEDKNDKININEQFKTEKFAKKVRNHN